MARRCKCYETKEIGTTDTFFKAPDGHYYKSEEIYNKRIARTEYRKKIMDKIAELTNYEPGQKFPTVVTRRLKELEAYDNKTIYETIVDHQDDILWSFNNKNFDNEYGRFSYMMAIIVNNINDVVNIKLRDEKINKIENRKINTEDIDVEFDLNTKHKVRDISCFLEEDDLWN